MIGRVSEKTPNQTVEPIANDGINQSPPKAEDIYASQFPEEFPGG